MRGAVLAVFFTACVGVLWYLHDPAWLIDQTTGLRPWHRASDGTLSRWSGGHASFFVPSNLSQIRIPVSTTFDPREPGGERPMLVTFSIDDRRVGRVLLTGPGWQEVTLPMPPPGSRRVRRIDVRTNITREDNHGVQIGQLCCFSSR
ncbi:MAG TPA: hypothetical protein VEL51_13015 [Vicinamibacterales bacterium]|nr:hypothetical protein [Vicinamibacterales bacterium]